MTESLPPYRLTMMNQFAADGALVVNRYSNNPVNASSESGADPWVSIDLTYYCVLAVLIRKQGRRTYEGIMRAVAGRRDFERSAG